MSTIKDIISAQWERRAQIFNLAKFDLIKQVRGTALGPFWLFAKPIVYVFVFWFALDIGLRGAKNVGGDAPYMLWLMAGLIPWFYMQDQFSGGINVFSRFAYLVTKIKFPLPAIPTIYALSNLFVNLCLVVALVVAYFIFGQPLEPYLLQVPVAIILMVVFFYMWSLATSCLSAISKDFKNFIHTLSTPIFWVSGIIFNVFGLGISWLETLLMFNPVTFIVTMFRCALYDRCWIWDKPMAVIGFVVVFAVMFIVMILIYRRTHEEVPDVL